MNAHQRRRGRRSCAGFVVSGSTRFKEPVIVTIANRLQTPQIGHERLRCK